MNTRHPLHSFSIKNIFYDKMGSRLFYDKKVFFVFKWPIEQLQGIIFEK